MVGRWRWQWRGGSCKRGCDGCAEGVGARGEGGRRLASGRQPFCSTATSSGSLLFPPPPPSPSLPSSSPHPPSNVGTSLRVLVVSFVLCFSPSRLSGFSSGYAVCVLSILLVSFSLSLACFRSARLNVLSQATLRSIFVSFFAFARLPRTLFRDLAPEDRWRVYTRFLPIFARSKHST